MSQISYAGDADGTDDENGDNVDDDDGDTDSQRWQRWLQSFLVPLPWSACPSENETTLERFRECEVRSDKWRQTLILGPMQYLKYFDEAELFKTNFHLFSLLDQQVCNMSFYIFSS